MEALKTTRPRTLLAIGQLVESLAARQRAARADLARRFARFAAKKNTARFRSIFSPCARSMPDDAGNR
jgi:hypothetical protein